jgi:hypothetical protein
LKGESVEKKKRKKERKQARKKKHNHPITTTKVYYIWADGKKHTKLYLNAFQHLFYGWHQPKTSKSLLIEKSKLVNTSSLTDV